MPMRQRHIAAFMALAETGSFKAAADRLHQSPAALSVSIKDLEHQAAVKLFERTTRRVELTEAGNAFVPVARRALLANQEAQARLAEIATGHGGRLRLAAAPSVALAWLPQAIAAFTQARPGVQISVIEGTASRVAEAIHHGEADLGIQGRSPASQGLVSEVVYRDPIVRFGEGELRIGLTEGTHTEQLLAGAGVSEPHIRVDSAELAIALARRLGGQVLLPALTLRGLPVRATVGVPPRELCRMTRTPDQDAPIISAFMRTLTRVIQSPDGAT